MKDKLQVDILNVLNEINNTLEILTEEHITHFKEWREKNSNGMPKHQIEELKNNPYIWIFDKPVKINTQYNDKDIVLFNKGDPKHNLFNYGYNESYKHTYCDLYDHGIFRVSRDNTGDIIEIVLIRDGRLIKLTDYDRRSHE